MDCTEMTWSVTTTLLLAGLMFVRVYSEGKNTCGIADFATLTEKQKYIKYFLELVKTDAGSAFAYAEAFYNVVPRIWMGPRGKEKCFRAQDQYGWYTVENHAAIKVMQALIKSGRLHNGVASIASRFIENSNMIDWIGHNEKMQDVLVNTDSTFWDLLRPELIKAWGAEGKRQVDNIIKGAERVRAEASAVASTGACAAGGAGAGAGASA